MPFAATWMKLELLILSEISQKKKDKYHDITYIWNLIYGTNEPNYRKVTNSQTWKTDLQLPGGGGGSGMDWEFGVSRHKLLHLEWKGKEVLLHSTGTISIHLLQNMIDDNMRKRMYIYV